LSVLMNGKDAVRRSSPGSTTGPGGVFLFT
jgi:hypothetical protein